MQFSLFNIMAINDPRQSARSVMDTTKAAVAIADQTGFDGAWFAEHHFSAFSICGSPTMMAMHCAGFTKRIRLGPGVLVVPLHQPTRMIEEIAMLDAASGGRAMIGIGTGHQPHEFRSMGVSMEERRDRLFEGWDVLDMALATGRAAYDGRYVHVPETVFPIIPATPPELFVATHDAVVMARAAQRGATIFLSAGPRLIPAAQAIRADIFAAGASVGVAADEMKIALLRYCFVTEDRVEARVAAEGVVGFMRRMRSLRMEHPPRDGIHLDQIAYDGEPEVDWLLENAAIGTPEIVAERLVRDIGEIRPGHIAYYMGFSALPDATVLRSVRLFGEQVLPRLRAAASQHLDANQVVDAAASTGVAWNRQPQ